MNELKLLNTLMTLFQDDIAGEAPIGPVKIVFALPTMGTFIVRIRLWNVALFGSAVYALYRLHSDSEIAVMYAAGVSRLEFDVQLTADRIPVLLHDTDLSRTCGIHKNIHSLKREFNNLKNFFS